MNWSFVCRSTLDPTKVLSNSTKRKKEPFLQDRIVFWKSFKEKYFKKDI